MPSSASTAADHPGPCQATKSGTPRPYHHGDLRRAILNAALDVISADGPSALSLRDLARRAGVSHAAPAHHFKDRTGLLTAIAAEGYELLAATLAEAADLKDAGVRYVRFAREHPAHFQVMFTPELLRTNDLELTTARALAGERLRTAVSGGPARGPRHRPPPRRSRRLVPGPRLRHAAPQPQPGRTGGRPGPRGGLPCADRDALPAQVSLTGLNLKSATTAA